MLIGEKQCKWAAWYQTHFKYVSTESTYDEVAHKIKHTALRDRILADLRGRECWVNVEHKVFIEGNRTNLSGKIDLIACKGERGIIFELKSGKPYPTDKAQLMLYMWALRRAYRRFQHVLFDGRVVIQTKK